MGRRALGRGPKEAQRGAPALAVPRRAGGASQPAARRAGRRRGRLRGGRHPPRHHQPARGKLRRPRAHRGRAERGPAIRPPARHPRRPRQLDAPDRPAHLAQHDPCGRLCLAAGRPRGLGRRVHRLRRARGSHGAQHQHRLRYSRGDGRGRRGAAVGGDAQQSDQRRRGLHPWASRAQRAQRRLGRAGGARSDQQHRERGARPPTCATCSASWTG